jgi:methyl-accepting chemotaxis protein
MEEIVASVKQVTDIMSEISAASQEQSNGIGEVNLAIAQMDHMTQQNSALIEQAAAAAESMQQQTDKLDGVVRQFIIADTGGHTTQVRSKQRIAPQGPAPRLTTR